MGSWEKTAKAKKALTKKALAKKALAKKALAKQKLQESWAEQKLLESERSGFPAFTLKLPLRNILNAILLLLGSALGSYASQLTLSPIYGAIPASLHHDVICASIFIAVWAGKGFIRRFDRQPLGLLPILAFYDVPAVQQPVYRGIPASSHHRTMCAPIFLKVWAGRGILPNFFPRLLWLLPVLAFYVPAVQRHLFQYSETWGAEYGPIYTEALSYYPTLFLVVLISSYFLEMQSFALDIVPWMASYGFFRVAEKFIATILSYRIGKSWLYTRCGLTNIAAGLYCLHFPTALSPIALLLALPGILHTAFYNPGCTENAGIKYLNATLASANLTVLARTESLTGYLSVMDSSYAGYRVMRCDHSLLGGDWLEPPEGFEHVSSGGKEPIYPVFVMLEAVRLVTPGPAAREPKALMIGLGVGTSHNGMMRHGVETHIVELDPMVYQYAKDYFGLLPNHTAHIMDAVEFVKNAAAAPKLEQYDFIIHDVFTGRAAPAALFTMDMMQGVSKILKDDGVVAIHYAGDLKQRPARIVIQTIYFVFGHCKVFRADEPLDGDKAVDFTNMNNCTSSILHSLLSTTDFPFTGPTVIFCTKSTQDFHFRHPLERDYLHSPSRQKFLFPTFEVTLDTLFSSDGRPVKRAVLDNQTMLEFKQRQKRDAVHHWEIMRTVINKEGWENY